MNKKLYLPFLWHMHQPYYKDDCKNTTLMPWVFLHATKDYYDIPWYKEKFPNIKATFNLVPSLITQLEEYINDTANDKLLIILRKEISFLKQEEILFLEEYLFLSNEHHMIKPLSRYYDLLLKFRGNSNSLNEFNENEILDVQTLFLLSWCGNYLRQKSKLIQDLINQGQNFSQEQKLSLLDEMLEFLKEVIPYYENLASKGEISISTTPFYHPILPLLIDRSSAKEARTDVILPSSNENYEDFASMQVEKAIKYFESKFKKRPIGFWPSEGSVSIKTASLLAKKGIKWACSDEEILFKSIGSFNKELLYKPYKLKVDDKEIDFFFRDKYLSDLIGFDYSKKDAKEAAVDFVNHLKNIYLNSNKSVIVPVILDGENAWEFYPNNAQEFFYELYQLLDEQSWCETILFDEVDDIEDLKYLSLPTLASGSWINGNFDIWIGSHEKNLAWQLLDMTKNSFNECKSNLDEETLEKVEKEFMIALGSDWFWWYGDDHYTELNHHFDEQFRNHLKNIYELMNQEIPRDIFIPIVRKDKGFKINKMPTDFISPIVDGNRSNFFEWLNSGFIDIKKGFSTMDSSSSLIETMHYGIDKHSNLYLLFEGKKLKNIKEEYELRLILDEKIFIFDMKKSQIDIEQNGHFFKIAFDEGFEIKVEDFKQLKVKFSFEIYNDKKVIQKYPLYDEMILDFENLYLKSWYI